MESVKSLNQVLKAKIKELEDLNRNTLITIETLENDNEVRLKEVKELRQKIYNTHSENKGKPPTSDNQRLSTSNNCKSSIEYKRNKLLTVDGENTTGCALLFKKYSNRLYDINCQVFAINIFL